MSRDWPLATLSRYSSRHVGSTVPSVDQSVSVPRHPGTIGDRCGRRARREAVFINKSMERNRRQTWRDRACTCVPFDPPHTFFTRSFAGERSPHLFVCADAAARLLVVCYHDCRVAGHDTYVIITRSALCLLSAAKVQILHVRCSSRSHDVRCQLVILRWLRGTAVERRSVTGELSLSYARPAADG